MIDIEGKYRQQFHMIIVEILTLATIIGPSATWLAKNKYQPGIERVWENRNSEEKKRYTGKRTEKVI